MTQDATRLPFFRVTVLGHSNSGKTALINSFVNGFCPQRYNRTDNTVLYYKKVEIDDESEYHDVRKPVFLEIEDTPGSERGHEDDDTRAMAALMETPASSSHHGGIPTIKKGSRVVLERDKQRLRALFDNFQPKGRVHYRPGMDAMLGREFQVKAKGKDGLTVGLQSPDGSEGGVWNFPIGAVELKIALTLPIDQYLTLGEKDLKYPSSVTEKSKFKEDLQHPFAAYMRPVKHQDEDRSLTKNRMGYFLCFDLSDEDGDSLREAMTLLNMLKKSLLTKATSRLKPKVWLVGCKQDRSAIDYVIRRNRESAQVWSDKEEIPFSCTSARDHKGIREVFVDMIQAISASEILWNLEGVEDDGETTKQEENCVIH